MITNKMIRQSEFEMEYDPELGRYTIKTTCLWWGNGGYF